MISRSSSKLGHVESKTRLLGQILEKHCVHSRGPSLEGTVLTKAYETDCIRMFIILISRLSLKLVRLGLKN